MALPPPTPTEDPLASYVQAGAALLALPIDPAWHDGVMANLRVILDQGAMLTDPSLADALDPAALFRA